MFKYKCFKTREAMINWIERHKHKYYYEEIFVNNGYCLYIKPLIKQ
jgi:hypothetical protein